MSAARSDQSLAHHDLEFAVGEYLAATGWGPVVVADVRVEPRERDPGDNDYELVVRFRGQRCSEEATD